MMKTLHLIIYQWKDLLRGRWMPFYALIFLILTDVLIRFGGHNLKALLSIGNAMLMFVPLISLVFGILYIHNSKDFIELMLAQPISRKMLFKGLYGGMAIPLMAAFGVGCGLPFLYLGMFAEGFGAAILFVLILGMLLTGVFTAMGYWIGLKWLDSKVKGFGIGLVAWLGLAVLYDGLILLLIVLFQDYPLEMPILAATALNPIDLARIATLQFFDTSTMMGYTGAVFTRFFGSFYGIGIAAFLLLSWLMLPLTSARKTFLKQDF